MCPISLQISRPFALTILATRGVKPSQFRKEKETRKRTNSVKVESIQAAEASQMSTGHLPPSYTRPRPPVSAPSNDETSFLLPPWPAELRWEPPEGPSTSGDAPSPDGLRDLVQRALQGPLLPGDQQRLIDLITERPRAPYEYGLGPQRLARLADNNPSVAAELLVVVRERLYRYPEYLRAVLEAGVGLNWMEVVNRLAGTGRLPPLFLAKYIPRCMAACEASLDKAVQARLVRLVCVFMTSLVRNGQLDLAAQPDLLVEVQAFCLDHSRVREAASLYRLLKGGDGAEGLAGGASGSGEGAGV